MPLYMYEAAYTAESLAAQIKNPQNRIEAVKPAFDAIRANILAAGFSFGDYDVVLITEMPNNVNAAAIAIAFAAGGACKAVQTTPLMSTAEALEAMKKAKESGYRPATTATGRAA